MSANAQPAALPPVRREILVKAKPEHVFRVFTERMDAWWPRDYKLGKAPTERLMLETRANGRWYQVSEEGVETQWGKVLVWDPPTRLVLAQQINTNWQYDPNLITEVEIAFVAEGVSATRVKLEHRYIERVGEMAPHIHSNLEGAYGWSHMLSGLPKVAEA